MANNDTTQTTQTIQSIQNNQSNLEAEIKQLKQLLQEILDIKTTLQNALQNTTTPTTTNTITVPPTVISEKIVPVPNESAITLSDLLIKSIVSRVENMLRFTSKFYTYILEMGPCIIIFLFIVRFILFDA